MSITVPGGSGIPEKLGPDDELGSIMALLQEAHTRIEALPKQQNPSAASAEQVREESSVFQRFMPAEMSKNAALAPIVKELENNLNDPKSGASLVLAEIMKVNMYLQRIVQGHEEKQSQRELSLALRDLGQALYAYHGKNTSDPIELATKISAWAKALEAEKGNAFKIRMARVGEQKDISWMNAPPNNRPVGVVQSWAVLDARGTALQRANVL